MDQCHLGQAWVHPECFGEDDKDIDRGTHETTSEVSVANIKENIAQLLRNAKTVKPTMTVSSVLPSK